MIRLIAAIDRERGIAKQNVIPWNIPEDVAFFNAETKKFGGHVLTGGVTFRITYKGRPLAQRKNYILTHNTSPIEGVTVIHDVASFLNEFEEADLWVAGGAAVFQEVMKLGRADELYLTHVDAAFGCDRFFPEYEESFVQFERSEPKQQNGFTFTYAKYRRAH